MKIRLKLFATLRSHRPPDVGEDGLWEVPQGATVGEVLDTLGIDPEVARIVFRNARHAARDDVLQEGDVLAVFPPLAGG